MLYSGEIWQHSICVLSDTMLECVSNVYLCVILSKYTLCKVLSYGKRHEMFFTFMLDTDIFYGSEQKMLNNCILFYSSSSFYFAYCHSMNYFTKQNKACFSLLWECIIVFTSFNGRHMNTIITLRIHHLKSSVIHHHCQLLQIFRNLHSECFQNNRTSCFVNLHVHA